MQIALYFLTLISVSIVLGLVINPIFYALQSLLWGVGRGITLLVYILQGKTVYDGIYSTVKIYTLPKFVTLIFGSALGNIVAGVMVLHQPITLMTVGVMFLISTIVVLTIEGGNILIKFIWKEKLQ